VENKKSEWEASYSNRDNFMFYPHEEVIRFFSRHIRKRNGLDSYLDLVSPIGDKRVLDLGCGIGRHVVYSHETGLQAYGIDLSEQAVAVAVEWAERRGMAQAREQILQGDIRHLPWSDGFFDYAVSHGVLDSMPFAIARMAAVELARVVRKGGLVYCDLISGDDIKHPREYAGEEVVTTRHEQGTVQSYFNHSKILELFGGLFDIDECFLIRREEVLQGSCSSRYHLTLRRT